MASNNDWDDWSESTDNDSNDFDSWESSSKSKKKELTTGKIVFTAIVCIVFSSLIGYITYGMYTKYISYPSEEYVDISMTGGYCLDNWCNNISNLESTVDNSYLNQEISFANGNQDKISFYKKMLSTVKYVPLEVVARNVFGNDLIDREGNTIYRDSYIWAGEEVDMYVIDYRAIDFSLYEDKIKFLMIDLPYDSVDYENKLVSVFISLMNDIPVESLPLRVIRRVPYIVDSGEGYIVTLEEDIYLDKLLFSSNDFYDCLDNFSEVAWKVSGGGTLHQSSEYRKWLRSFTSDTAEITEEEAGERPERFNYKQCCAKEWCGAYYLINEHYILDNDGNHIYQGVLAEVGDGSIGNPAGFETELVTSILFYEYDDLGKPISYESYPIRVSLIDYGVSQDAIDWFESKDIRNRGITLSSDVQYMYAVFEVTNLSNRELTIPENMGLCDRNENIQARTGIMYGLNSSVTLKPDETGYIETWQSSVELYNKYVIWGANFARNAKPIYYRVLAGDLENEDPFKGVTVNTSRKDKTSVEENASEDSE